MTKFIKRFDFNLLSVIIVAIMAVGFTVCNKGNNAWIYVLGTVLTTGLSVLVVNMLIYLSEYRRSKENNAPSYLDWFFTTRKIGFQIITFIVVFFPLVAFIIAPEIELVWEKLVVCFILYSSSFGLLYQPYSIYKRLISLDWFNKNYYKTYKG